MKEEHEIEKLILDIANEVLMEWNDRFKEISVTIDPLFISRGGVDDNYFSEIEFVFWKNDNIELFFSIIIFMGGKQKIKLNEIESSINFEINENYEELNNTQSI